jgi:two-component system sensor histidine kinase YesM
MDTMLEEIRASDIEGLSHVMFTDGTGMMLSGAFNTRSTRLKNELLSDYLVVAEPLNSCTFTLTALLNRTSVFAPFVELNRGILFALAIAVILFISYILFVQQSIINPLSRLITSIGGIQMGSFKPIPIVKNDATEIQDVYKALNTMTNEVEALKIRVYEEKLTQQNTQMQLFQLQLRPHFFLNALNTILSLARSNEYAMIQKMTLGLATHCRYILYNTWFVTIEEELSYTQNYIDMQNIQHDTKYHYVAKVPDELLDQEIPILAVQIFVENSLKYSARSESDIDITTSIAQLEFQNVQCIRIVIDDTGVGFGYETMRHLNDPMYIEPEQTDRKDHGIGIENVRSRLQILYHDQASLIFSNNERGGAHVELVLPMERKRK